MSSAAEAGPGVRVIGERPSIDAPELPAQPYEFVMETEVESLEKMHKLARHRKFEMHVDEPAHQFRQGPPLGDVVAATLAGTFAVRTDLARLAGGYLDGLGTRHQTELFVRLITLANEAGLQVSHVPDLLVRIEARRATERPGVNPRRLYDGTRWIIARHPAAYSGRARHVGLFEGVAGTNAARLGDWRAARRRLRRAVAATPLSR